MRVLNEIVTRVCELLDVQDFDWVAACIEVYLDVVESPPRPEPVAWVAPHNTLYLFDGYEFTIITRRPDGKLSFSGGDDMPENFDDEVGAAGIYRFVGSVHSAEGWTSEQCEAAGIPSDASNYSEWWNGHMEDATLADVAHVFGIPHPSVPPQRGDRGPADLAAAGVPVVNGLRFAEVCTSDGLLPSAVKVLRRIAIGGRVSGDEDSDTLAWLASRLQWAMDQETPAPVPPVVTEAMAKAALLSWAHHVNANNATGIEAMTHAITAALTAASHDEHE